MPSQGASDHLKVVPATEVLAKIQRGDPANYDNVIIKGDLNLNQLKLPKGHVKRSAYELNILGLSEDAKIITSPIEIRNATIDGNVNFNDTAFYSPIDFSGSNFTNFAIFHGVQFSAHNNVFSDVAVFSGMANFNNARFDNGVDFTGASGPAYFMDTKFDKVTHFWGAQLYDTWFSRAKFYSTYTDFRRVQFIGITSFSEAQFYDEPLFDEAQFEGDTYFRGTKFNGKAHFVGSQFRKNVDFTDANFGGDAVFNGAKFRGYTIGWENIENVFKCDEATYLGLIQNLKDYGQFSDADNCYYEYMNWRRDQNSGFSKFFDYVFWAICGYGVKPERPPIVGGVLLIFFGFLYFSRSYRRASTRDANEQKFKEAIWFSTIALLALPRELYPYGEKKYENLIRRSIGNLQIFRILFIFERLIGWGLLILFINTISRIMIRY